MMESHNANHGVGHSCSSSHWYTWLVSLVISFFIRLCPPLSLCPKLFNLFECVELTAIYPRACGSGHVPLEGRLQIRSPPRPGSALVWPDAVNFAAFGALMAGQEYAVF